MTVSGFCITSFQLAGLWSRRGGGSWHAFSVLTYFNNFRPGSHWVCRLYHKKVSRSKRYLRQKGANRDAKLLPIWPSYIHSLLYKKKKEMSQSKMKTCGDGGADVNFLRLCSLFSGRRLSVCCLLHLKGNVNTRDSNLWQNVKSASGGSGWEMVEKCGKGGGGHRWGLQRPNSVKSYVGAAGCSWELVLFAALLWSCVHWGG